MDRPMHEIFDQFKQQLPDIDPVETREWLDSLDAVVKQAGPERARFLFYKLHKRARQLQVGLPPLVQTRYINTISPEQEPEFPGDESMELRIRRMIRWNALAMVLRANTKYEGIGGHLSTYASAASLYEVGFNHFFRGPDEDGTGDQVFFQGHAAPGIYARAFLEGRLTEEQLDHFRREALTPGTGLSSYPHPRLMPDFWQFPTVSMGLGPMAAVYQARFNRYLHARGMADTSKARVWAFLGDGEMDEPEALGALPVAAREGLDNLIFVVNCNLQRLDGPVRGNGKIIQELEALFRGAGWHVIKVIWAREWDDLLARDVDGVLVNKMNETLDGDYQRMAVSDGAYIREHFFGPDPRLKKLVEHLSDEDLTKLRRGGHDYRKVYAAYAAAVAHRGAPVAILAKTVKGWTLGPGIEGRNVTHQAKKLTLDELKIFRDRLQLEIPDDKLKDAPYYHPGPDAPEIRYMLERRRQLGGVMPRRIVVNKPLPAPREQAFAEFFAGSERPASTTMAFSRMIRNLVRDPEIGKRIVPIIPDEARTFGMDPLFKEVGIYNPLGQRYRPVDAELLLSYLESETGQLLEEGITEAGAMASFQAAATSYATWATPMVPFYTFYSMFGPQRTGDQVWALGDSRGRGFMMGATAGRTTLTGEGLQHDDGQSHVLISTLPNVRAYDPAFAYELAIVVRDGIGRMYGETPEDVFYYLTIYNENWVQPPKPDGVEEGVIRGLYRFKPAEGGSRPAQLLASGPIMQQALRAQRILAEKFDVAADVWSATSFQLLRNEALDVERWNRLHPDAEQRVPYVRQCLDPAQGPVVAATDYMKAVPDMIARWVDRPYVVLGTDGFGRSDTRDALRDFFEVNAEQIAYAALYGLCLEGKSSVEELKRAMGELDIDPERVNPLYA
ncbi:MAG TPA: pyruvate dehydrogenase (acetyl-transferring), homodimeric type [candidate division Zixibacteria bacterium]|nr:pyruvate dehydrogenase (acetyl-transferring), homodimeric type [candidate division Zixibacteria bacterium]